MKGEENRANIGYISGIVAVATIGGLLFGYDSGAVNGTQGGLPPLSGWTRAGSGSPSDHC